MSTRSSAGAILGLLFCLLTACSAKQPRNVAETQAPGTPEARLIARMTESAAEDQRRAASRFDSLRQRRTNYACADGRGFTLVLMGSEERFAVILDEGRGFNLKEEPADRGKQYGDGTIRVDIEGMSAAVDVEGKPYFRDCSLQSAEPSR
jgi:membrane-bound inhibitor of C-type lysozyme